IRFTMRHGSEPAEDFDLVARNDALKGTLSVANAGSHPVAGTPSKKDDKPAKKPEPPVPVPAVAGNSEASRAAKPAQPATVLSRTGSVWTRGPTGILEDTDVLVKAGKISAIGKKLAAPGNAVVIDATGKHVAPGIIDEHSHSAILGNVNECTNSVTCE